jgi:hypothetical protein
MNIDLDVRVRRIVDVAEELFADNGVVADFPVNSLDDFPSDFGGVLRDAPEDFAIEVFDDFGAALFGPLRGRGDLFPVLQGEDVGQIGIGVGGGLVVVGVVGRGFGAAGAGAEGLDAELIHHVLVVIGGGPFTGIDIGNDGSGFGEEGEGKSGSCAKGGELHAN